MTLFRGFGDDLPLMEWLETKIWPAEARLEPEDVYWGTRLAAVEMIRSGTTRFIDMYWHDDQVEAAVADAGLRAVVSSVLIDELDPAKGEGLRAQALESLDRLADAGPLIDARPRPARDLHGQPRVPRLARRGRRPSARSRSTSTSPRPRRRCGDCVEAHGKRPAQYLDELGFLGERTVLAHGVWLDDGELELIAERGATVVTNPAANMKLAVGGAFPYSRAAERGVRIGLGTDGASSNNNLDLIEEAKLLALLQKHESGDPSVLPASEALAIARGQRSPLLGGAPLEPGQPADFLLLRGEELELSAGDHAAGLVYAASGAVVRHHRRRGPRADARPRGRGRRRGDRRGARAGGSPHSSPNRFARVRTKARFPELAAKREGGPLRELLPEAGAPRRRQGRLDPAHGPQAAGRGDDLRALVRPLRRRRRRARARPSASSGPTRSTPPSTPT